MADFKDTFSRENLERANDIFDDLAPNRDLIIPSQVGAFSLTPSPHDVIEDWIEKRKKKKVLKEVRRKYEEERMGTDRNRRAWEEYKKSPRYKKMMEEVEKLSKEQSETEKAGTKGTAKKIIAGRTVKGVAKKGAQKLVEKGFGKIVTKGLVPPPIGAALAVGDVVKGVAEYEKQKKAEPRYYKGSGRDSLGRKVMWGLGLRL